MAAISRAWYEGLYPKMLVPIKTLKLYVLPNKTGFNEAVYSPFMNDSCIRKEKTCILKRDS